jgi:hypothetical protein
VFAIGFKVAAVLPAALAPRRRLLDEAASALDLGEVEAWRSVGRTPANSTQLANSGWPIGASSIRRFAASPGAVILRHGASSALTPCIVPTTSQTDATDAFSSDENVSVYWFGTGWSIPQGRSLDV